ncbi:MAG TPA: YcxB family protein [Flavobacterium sp.]|nr:YcxB family protein [Flavobacterium sp.]
MEKQIVYKPSFLFKDYLKINYTLFLKKASVNIIFIVCLIIIITNIIININNSTSLKELISFQMVFFCFIPVIIILIPYQITKMTLSDSKLKENIQIKINIDELEFLGESFQNKFKWNNVLKITETKKWIILHLDSKKEIIIQKRDITADQQLILKRIIASVKELK